MLGWLAPTYSDHLTDFYHDVIDSYCTLSLPTVLEVAQAGGRDALMRQLQPCGFRKHTCEKSPIGGVPLPMVGGDWDRRSSDMDDSLISEAVITVDGQLIFFRFISKLNLIFLIRRKLVLCRSLSVDTTRSVPGSGDLCGDLPVVCMFERSITHVLLFFLCLLSFWISVQFTSKQ